MHLEDTTADAGEAGTASASRPTDLADATALDAFVADHDVALVEFYTDGCGICASMEPVLSNVARASGAAVALVNPRDDPPLVERFEVRSVPLLVLFVDGEAADHQWRVAGESGIALVVTGKGSTMAAAREQAYGRVQDVLIPNMYYRDDIGQRWLDGDGDRLQAWGYLGPA